MDNIRILKKEKQEENR